MAQFNTTELDFDQIKNNLKDYFKRGDSQFRDWDFDGSGLNNLLDILAYNTHYNAMNAHVAMNESFLDSAQVRANVVSRAKLLGYIPTSKSAAVANIDLILTPKENATNEAYSLNRGTSFSTSIDDTNYTFLLLEDTQVPLSTDNEGNRSYRFNDLSIYQGALKERRYAVDNSVQNQKFVIDDPNVDTTSIVVRVYENANSQLYSVYSRFDQFSSTIDGNSTIYFIEENYDGKYEIHFGNNSIGKLPGNAAIVEIDFLSTKGNLANGASSFTWNGGANAIIDGTSTLVVNSKSAGGSNIENIESIRYNAPLSYIAQNRAVTVDDYQVLVKQLYGSTDSISVWGGEYNDPPQFGKAFISIKPTGALTTTNEEKELIIEGLQNKRILSIEPVIVDPDYTYVFFNVFFKYNSNLTALTTGQMQSNVRSIIQQFNQENLQNFDGVFRYSSFLQAIDRSDPAILNSFARVFLYKDLNTVFGSSVSLELKFNNSLYVENPQNSIIQSSSWLYTGLNYYIGDEGSGVERNVYVYRLVEGAEVKVVNSIGTLNTSTGKLVVNNSLIPLEKNETIRIEVSPNSNDIITSRNNILQIDEPKSTVIGEIDTIAVAGVSGLENYNTVARTSGSGGILSNQGTSTPTSMTSGTTGNTSGGSTGNTGGGSTGNTGGYYPS
jgi:hypothetical protein